MAKPPRKTALLKAYAKTWTSFEPVTITEEMRVEYNQLLHCQSIFANSRLEVQCFAVPSAIGGVMQIVVARHGAIEAPTYDDLQRAKIELFGPEAVAVEIYPGIADEWQGGKNVRVLWILPSTWQLPFGLHLPGSWGKPA